MSKQLEYYCKDKLAKFRNKNVIMLSFDFIEDDNDSYLSLDVHVIYCVKESFLLSKSVLARINERVLFIILKDEFESQVNVYQTNSEAYIESLKGFGFAIARYMLKSDDADIEELNVQFSIYELHENIESIYT